jgi:hypothetical protein
MNGEAAFTRRRPTGFWLRIASISGILDRVEGSAALGREQLLPRSARCAGGWRSGVVRLLLEPMNARLATVICFEDRPAVIEPMFTMVLNAGAPRRVFIVAF